MPTPCASGAGRVTSGRRVGRGSSAGRGAVCILALLALTMTACQTRAARDAASQAAEDGPSAEPPSAPPRSIAELWPGEEPEGTRAVIVEPCVGSRATLEAAVARALGVRKVLVGDDALAKSSLLVVEAAPRESIERPPEPGFATEPPDRFRLLLTDQGCELVHLNTGHRQLLFGVECRAEAGE